MGRDFSFFIWNLVIYFRFIYFFIESSNRLLIGLLEFRNKYVLNKYIFVYV